MKTLTRREVIEIWNRDERFHDYFVCPDCRDILRRIDTPSRGIVLRCENAMCKNEDYFSLKGELIV